MDHISLILCNKMYARVAQYYILTDIGITPILLPLQHSSSEPMVIGKMHILHIYA